MMSWKWEWHTIKSVDTIKCMTNETTGEWISIDEIEEYFNQRYGNPMILEILQPYMVVAGLAPEELMERVNWFIMRGWRPQGSMVYAPKFRGHEFFFQAVVNPEVTPKISKLARYGSTEG
jgi:hypothetical protein